MSILGSIGDWFNGIKTTVSDAWNQLPTLNNMISNAASSLSQQIGDQLSSFSSALSDSLKNSSLGTAAANKQAEKAAAAARAFNAEQTQKVIDWETQMSNTAFQRARADAEAAGFNPILGYMQGGASTPSATPASASAAQTFKSSGVVDTLEVLSPVLETLVKGMNSAFKTAAGSEGDSSSASKDSFEKKVDEFFEDIKKSVKPGPIDNSGPSYRTFDRA